MSTTVDIDGISYRIPGENEVDWAAELTALLTKLAQVADGGGGAPDLALAAVGTSPNDNAATYNSTTGVLNLEPGSTTKKGVVKVTNGNGLSISSGTIAQALATVSAAGAMSARHKANADSLAFIAVDPTETDFVTAFNAAVTAATAAGYTHIHFGDGTWVADCGGLQDDSDLVTVPAGWLVTGNGRGRSIISVENASDGDGEFGVNVFKINSRVTVEGLEIAGENDPFGFVFNNQGCAIRINNSGADDCTVRRCHFTNLFGFSVHDSNTNNERNNVIECSTYQCANGINVCSSYSIQAFNTLVESEGFETSGRGVILANNSLTDCYGVGLTIGGDQTPGIETPGCVVMGNTISGCTSGVGLTVTDGSVGALITGNHIRECETGGIVVAGTGTIRQCVFLGNVVDSNCKDPGANLTGFSIQDGAGGHMVYANFFIDSNVSGFDQKYGLNISVPNCVIDANVLNGTSVDALLNNGATNTRFGSANYCVNGTEQWVGTASRAALRTTGVSASDIVEFYRVWNLSTLSARAYFALQADGKHLWGDNLNLLDTNLYRSAADTLKTDDSFVAVGTVTGSNLSGTNTGDVTIGTFGSAPDAKAATISSQVLTIQPADATHPGAIALGAQTLGSGAKTMDSAIVKSSAAAAGLFDVWNTTSSGYSTLGFKDSAAGTTKFVVGHGNSLVGTSTLRSKSYLQFIDEDLLLFKTTAGVDSVVATFANATGDATFANSIFAANLSGTNTGNVTLAAVGSSPSANAASLSGQVLTLQPADATHPGVVSLGAQTLGSGTKTMDAALVTSSVSAAGIFDVQNTSTSGYSTAGFKTTGGTTRVVFGYGNASVANASLQSIGYLEAVDTNFRFFKTTSGVTVESARMDNSTGNWTFQKATSFVGDATFDSTTLFVDTTNHRVGVGTTSPQVPFHLKVNTTGVMGRVQCDNSAGFPGFAFYNDVSSGTALAGIGIGNSATASPFAGNMYIQSVNGANMLFLTGTGASASERARILTNGRVLIGTTTDDGSNLLQVNGTAALIGNGGTVLAQTNTISGITNKTFSSMTHSGTLALGSSSVTGSWSFSGTPTIGGNATLSGTITFSTPIVYSGAASITAFATGGQASATALTKEVNYVDTVASAGDSVKLLTPALGSHQVVYNDGANSCNVYPPSGAAIDGLGTNNPYSLAAGTSREFYGKSATLWKSR